MYKKLDCSTQPIYFSFKNMEELKSALTERAIGLHAQHVRDSMKAHAGTVQLPKCMALSCCLFPAFVLHRMDSLFCRWAGYCASEPPVPLCADAVGGVPCAVLFVRCLLAAQYSSRSFDDDFRCGASDSVHPIILLIRIFPNPS